MKVTEYDGVASCPAAWRRDLIVRALSALHDGYETAHHRLGTGFVAAHRNEDGTVEVFEATLHRALVLDPTEAMRTPAQLEALLEGAENYGRQP